MSSKISLLNVQVDKLTIEDLNKIIEKIISDDRMEIIANHNMHSAYLCNNLPEIREFWNKAKKTHIDGMPLILWSKVLGYKLNSENRVTYLDWIHPLMKLADSKNYRVFYLGGKPGVANSASDKLNSQYPNINFEVHSGYFDVNSHENSEVIKKINRFKPNILMVGMGMPRQERWILDNFENIRVNVILNSGACFDYIAGEQKTPPRFLGKIGLEWFYRLVNDPKRLSRRYLVEPLSLFPLFVKDIKKIYFHKL